MKFDPQVMCDPQRHLEIDVRPILGQFEYLKFMEENGGKLKHKVYVRRMAEKKQKTVGGDVLEKIQYWYPEGELNCHLLMTVVLCFSYYSISVESSLIVLNMVLAVTRKDQKNGQFQCKLNSV